MNKQIKYAHKMKMYDSDEFFFTHIGNAPFHCSLYDDTITIYKLEVWKHEDQSIPTHEWSQIHIDYWGWVYTDKISFEMIYASMITFGMCFGYGYKKSEECGDGKAYRLHVKEIGKVDKNG